MPYLTERPIVWPGQPISPRWKGEPDRRDWVAFLEKIGTPICPNGGTVMSKMNPVVHFEMPYDDRERMAKFYQNAFGWQTQMLGEDMGNYVLATITETVDRRPKEPGAINGGFFPKRPDWPAQHPSVVIAVDDIQAAMKTVAEAGGKVLGEPLEIPGVGQYVSFFDTEGNRVSMLQPLPRN
jgi:uncharacterized protein